MKNFILDFTKTVLSCFRILKNSKFTNLVLPKSDKNDLIILGTGPSLKPLLNEYIESLKQYDLMAVNKFCTQKEYVQLQPRHYVLLDMVFSTKENTADKVKIRHDTFEALLNDTSWEMDLFFPSNTDMKEDISTLFSKNTFITVHYFNMTTVEGIDSLTFWFYKKGYGMPFAGNVLTASLWLALNMEYKRIILAGADMSMHTMANVNEDNQLCLGDTYYYNKKTACIEIDQKVDAYFLKIARTFEAFKILKEYANHKNIEIINSTTRSFIDIFEKKEAKNIFLKQER